MKLIKFSLLDRLRWTCENRPAVYEMIKGEVDDARIVEILNFNDIPKGYLPPPVNSYDLTKRVQIACDFLKHNAPGFSMVNTFEVQRVVWIGVYKHGDTRATYKFQMEDGVIHTFNIKVTIANQIHLNLWQKYVLKEGGAEAGVKIETA